MKPIADCVDRQALIAHIVRELQATERRRQRFILEHWDELLVQSVGKMRDIDQARDRSPLNLRKRGNHEWQALEAP